MTEIKLNVVGITINGKVVEFYKMSFGFRRKLIEVQLKAAKMVEEYARIADVEPTRDAVLASDKVTEVQKLELGNAYLDVQSALAELFVNKEDANLLDLLDEDGISTLIIALQ